MALRQRRQVTLAELAELEPIEQGLAEVVAYVELAHSAFDTVIDEESTETIAWTVDHDEVDGGELTRMARLPKIIFVPNREGPTPA